MGLAVSEPDLDAAGGGEFVFGRQGFGIQGDLVAVLREVVDGEVAIGVGSRVAPGTGEPEDHLIE